MDSTVLSACAVLPAGGSGERFGTQTPKQFCSMLGRPLVSYTLEAFERVAWIEHIVLVVSSERWAEVEQVLRTYGHQRVSLAEGCTTRHRSIHSGVQALEKGGFRPEIVIIHDAVRPFVDDAILEKVAFAAKEFGAAGATRPLVSTVVRTTQDSMLDQSLDRAKYRASEMPQAFRRDVINKAYQTCTEHDLEFGTECLHLAQKYGDVTVQLIEGPASLWKVTHKSDIYAAEGMLKERYNTVVVTGPFGNPQVQNSLTTAMKAHSLQVSFTPDMSSTAASHTQYTCCVHPLSRPLPEPDVLSDTVLNHLPRGRHPTMTSGIILVLFQSEADENCRLERLRNAVHVMSSALLGHRMYLNLVCVVSVTGSLPVYADGKGFIIGDMGI